MAKRTHQQSSEQDAEEAFLLSDDFDYDFDEYHEVQPKLKRRGKRSRNARRLIEQYREDQELRARLDEYYYHTDD